MATPAHPHTGPTDDADNGPGPLSAADRALVDAAGAFGPPGEPGFWDHLPPARRASVRWAWGARRDRGPSDALERLRRGHAAQARPDLALVHSSWWVRALRDEPASVRLALAANLPSGVAGALRGAIAAGPAGDRPDRPADPTALACVLALWTFRLVGDLPERDDDPPVIAALTRFDARAVAKVVETAGLAKWALTPLPRPDVAGNAAARYDAFRAEAGESDPRFVKVATHDVASVGPGVPRTVARVGLSSVARLLNAAEPYRARWALQHLPYSTARTIRALMGTGARKAPMLARWETGVLRAALARLRREGRLPAETGAAP